MLTSNGEEQPVENAKHDTIVETEAELIEDRVFVSERSEDEEDNKSSRKMEPEPSPLVSRSRLSSKHMILKKKTALLRHLKTGVRLFALPRARYQWGDHQHEHHTVWGSLFFDLIYVGVAYQLGNILGDGLKNDDFLASLGLFIALYTSMEMQWMNKLYFDARFEAGDLFHRVWQIVIGAIVALAAESMVYSRMQDQTDTSTLTFSACLLAGNVIDAIVYVELTFDKADNVRLYARNVLITRMWMSLALIGSIISAALKAPVWVTALLWFIYAILTRVRIAFQVVKKYYSRKNSVPMHIDFSIHRLGEYIMLMLGESIISIIVVGLTPSANFIGTYILCYFLVAMLSMLIFGALPSHPDQHAMRRSAPRSMVFFIIYSLQAMSLISCGAGFKLILTSTDSTNEDLVPYAWLMSGSLVVLCSCLFIGRVMHHGIHEEYFLLQDRSDQLKRVAFWVMKIIGTFLFLVAPALNAPCWGLLLFYVLVATSLFLVQLWDLRAFEEHHRSQVEKEVQLRIEMFKKEMEEKAMKQS